MKVQAGEGGGVAEVTRGGKKNHIRKGVGSERECLRKTSHLYL